ncbi:MAG TPA: response regulator transcription factor [Gaiellaceae bacterium]|nr:response regulator transcription factor [Gaiellaceae bacterium]
MIRVLVVDDHALFRAGLRSRLAEERDIMPIGEAGSAEEAVVRARALHPDVILLDLLLPRKSGSEAVRELLRVSPQSRVLIVSSQASASAVRQAITAGACGYVPKRSTDRELLDAIRRVASGERYVDPDLGAQLVVPDRVPALEPLTDRERDVFTLLALGYTNQEIARMLFVSVRTVDSHRAHVMRKLDLETRAELVLLALSTGLIGPGTAAA